MANVLTGALCAHVDAASHTRNKAIGFDASWEAPMSSHVLFETVPSRGDERGFSHSVPESALNFLRGLRDVHIAELTGGGVRGNHYHLERHEVLLVRHEDRWILHYDEGESTEVHRVVFSGSGLVCVKVPPLWSHAVENDGKKPLVILALSDVPYTSKNPDTVRRVITSKA